MLGHAIPQLSGQLLLPIAYLALNTKIEHETFRWNEYFISKTILLDLEQTLQNKH